MIVMMMAMTPSEKASILPLVMDCPQFCAALPSGVVAGRQAPDGLHISLPMPHIRASL